MEAHGCIDRRKLRVLTLRDVLVLYTNVAAVKRARIVVVEMDANLFGIKEPRDFAEVLVHTLEPLEEFHMEFSLGDLGRIRARRAFKVNVQKAGEALVFSRGKLKSADGALQCGRGREYLLNVRREHLGAVKRHA